MCVRLLCPTQWGIVPCYVLGAVGHLEHCDFRVLALVCDGLAANWRLFKLHNSLTEVDKVSSPYSGNGRQIYIFF